MTVLENVMIGRHCRTKAFIFGAIFRTAATRKEEEEIFRLLCHFRKSRSCEFANEFADNLPYGAQRRLEIARALATEPFFFCCLTNLPPA